MSKPLTVEQIIRWGALWHSKNQLDGVTEHLLCENLLPALFVSRRQCREWIEARYGYLKARRDLRGEPHGWRLPQPVRVIIKLKESTACRKTRRAGK